MKTAIYFAIILSVASASMTLANTKVKECSQRQDIQNSGFKQVVNSSALNGLLLVGKKATYQVDSNNGKFKVISEQSFETGKSKIICGGGKSSQVQNFSMYAPTLIDGRKLGEQKYSFWQFHISANDSLFGIWNKKSRLLSQSKESWEDLLEKYGIHFQVFQVSKNLFEIHLQKLNDGTLEQLLIRYDVATEL